MTDEPSQTRPGEDSAGRARSGVSRRQFLVFTVSVGGSVLLPRVPRALAARGAATPAAARMLLQVLPAAASPVDVFRAADHMDLGFEFTNLNLVTAAAEDVLEAAGPGVSLITIKLPRQHASEEVITSFTPGSGKLITFSRLSGASRLVFEVTPPIPYTMQGLLDRVGDEMKLVPWASPPDSGSAINPRLPAADETHVEVPWRVFLTPRGSTDTTSVAFVNPTQPVTHAGRTEAWATRMGIRRDGVFGEPPDEIPKVRAAYTPDYSATGDILDTDDDNPFEMPLSTADRKRLVRQTADYDADGTHEPIDVHRFLLTCLGAQVDLRGDWEEGDLVSYRHRTWGGRDTFVRVVHRGHLFPFGHAASEIEVSERRFIYDSDGDLTGYLHKETFLAIGDPVMEYPAPYQKNDGRGFPFVSVEITSPVNTGIGKEAVGGLTVDEAYYVTFLGEDYPFACGGIDRDGQRATFTASMAFIPDVNDAPYFPGAGKVPDVMRDYLNDLAVDDPRRVIDLEGQAVALAESSPGSTGDTTQPVIDLTLQADAVVSGTTKNQLKAARQPAYHPGMAQAQVRLGEAEAITGETSPGVPVEFGSEYLTDGFDSGANPAELYVELLETQDMSFPDSSRSGGVATPSQVVTALTRIMGPTGGDLGDLADGEWNPVDALVDGLTEGGAKLLGSLSLADVVQSVTNLSNPANRLKLPKFTSRAEFPGGDIAQLPERICRTLDWDPTPKSDPLGLFLVADDLEPGLDNPFDGPTTLHLHGEFCVPVTANEEPSYEVTGELRNFAISILSDFRVLVLYFERVEFTGGSAAPASVDVSILDAVFAGPLSFVEAFREWLTSLGNGPSIDVDASGVTAGVEIDIPDLGFGVFSMTQMAFGMDITLPFDGDPATVTFSFSSREDPFRVTVLGLGGEGHFSVTLSADGLVAMEFSIGVAAQVSLDIIVASGSVGISAGFAYEIEVTDTSPLTEVVTLIAYVEVYGEMSVLGVISISVEVTIALEYVETTVGDTVEKKLTGTATVEVEVDVLFVHESVSLEFSYTFDAGSGPAAPLPAAAASGGRGRPASEDTGFHFGDLYVVRSQWNSYCGAFASP